jgi:hypothetical protein
LAYSRIKLPEIEPGRNVVFVVSFVATDAGQENGKSLVKDVLQ